MKRKTVGPVQTRIDFENKDRLRHIPLYYVRLHRTDPARAPRAINVLQSVFHFPRAMAEEIVAKAQTAGFALCAVEPWEHAEFHCEEIAAAGIGSSLSRKAP